MIYFFKVLFFRHRNIVFITSKSLDRWNTIQILNQFSSDFLFVSRVVLIVDLKVFELLTVLTVFEIYVHVVVPNPGLLQSRAQIIGRGTLHTVRNYTRWTASPCSRTPLWPYFISPPPEPRCSIYIYRRIQNIPTRPVQFRGGRTR
jgi:hypothetical protein